MLSVHALHLRVVGSEPVTEGRFGCDYAWNDDFTAYWCMPHRWMPGSDESYAAWQAGDIDDRELREEREPVVEPVAMPTGADYLPPWTDDDVPF